MRGATLLVVAVGLGVALSVILTSAGLRAPGVPVLLGVAVLITSCVFIGWLIAQFTSTPLGLAVAPIVVMGMIGVALAVKLLLLPLAPLVGDGPAVVFVIVYAGAGATGALLGRAHPLRVRAAAAARTGLWVTAAALILCATTFALDAVIAAGPSGVD
jgi:hypothetical protein